jgi:hypothetical protein
MKSLNADICAAVNKWFHCHEVGAESLSTIQKRASEPIVRINRLATIDTLILKLKEFRDTAIRCGGNRFLFFEGDHKGDPKFGLHICVTDQAIALQGKVPSLYAGAVFDNVTGTRGERPKRLEVVATPGNARSLIDQLKAAKARGDVAEQRKIRATMRKVGIKGG